MESPWKYSATSVRECVLDKDVKMWHGFNKTWWWKSLMPVCICSVRSLLIISEMWLLDLVTPSQRWMSQDLCPGTHTQTHTQQGAHRLLYEFINKVIPVSIHTLKYAISFSLSQTHMQTHLTLVSKAHINAEDPGILGYRPHFRFNQGSISESPPLSYNYSISLCLFPLLAAVV